MDYPPFIYHDGPTCHGGTDKHHRPCHVDPVLGIEPLSVIRFSIIVMLWPFYLDKTAAQYLEGEKKL